MEIIFNSQDYATLLADAKKLGFVSDDGSIITNGTFESGGGWFLNIVGDVYETIGLENSPIPVKREGYWGRLRLNGQPQQMPSFSSAITQYFWSNELDGWTDDGVTPAPDFVQNIGIIA